MISAQVSTAPQGATRGGAVDYNHLTFEEFSRYRTWKFNRVRDVKALNQAIAQEAVEAVRRAGAEGRRILIILPVGPLDFSYWARRCNELNVSCEPLVILNMDEYLDERGRRVPGDHPLSLGRFVQESFLRKLRPALRPNPANWHLPDPRAPQRSTELIESFGGADLCYAGFGITGHFAFNDPPPPEEPCDDEAVRHSRTRTLTIMRETQAQMAMGGTGGNWDIVPKRAITLGLYELLLSKKLHLTFMRNWHAGVLRRALFGPVTGRCPGSFVQEHPNVEVTLTELAARLPLLNTLQATGEKEEMLAV